MILALRVEHMASLLKQHETFIPADSEFHVRPAAPSDRAEIESLIGEMIPGCDVSARWDWLYDANPAGRALTWLAMSRGGEVAGCTSFFPFRLWLHGTAVRGALGGDGYVRPAFRRRGVGGLLHDASRRAMTAHKLGCMYGAPGAMNVTPLKHGGSKELGDVVRWARPIRLARAAQLTAAILRPRGTARLEPMEPHDIRVDLVWAQARTELKLAAVRDSAFYTWRFIEAPGGHEPAFLIVDRGRTIGACALEAMHDGRTLRIVDVMAAPGAWHDCLGAIARHAADFTEAWILDIKLMGRDGRRRRMWRSGFTERQSKPFLCMIPAGGDRRFLDPDAWFYCGADSDIACLS
jgi:hypothetical protein